MAKKTKTTAKKVRPSEPAWLKWLAIGIIVLAVAGILIFIRGISADSSMPVSINVKEAYTLYNDGALVLDVRTQEEWDQYHIPNAIFIPLEQLRDRMNELPQDKTIVVVCASGSRSQYGREILYKAGYKNVSSMAGGMMNWQASGYPMVSGQ